MKRKTTWIVSAIVMSVVLSVTVCALNHRYGTSELIRINVEALSNFEDSLKEKKWIVYRHENGDFNCTPGGKEACMPL